MIVLFGSNNRVGWVGLKRRLEVRSTLELSDIGRPGEGEERERNERQKETAKATVLGYEMLH